MFEQAVFLAMVSNAILLGIVGYDLHAKRRERLIAVRRKALNDAFDALASLEVIAEKAADEALNEPPSVLTNRRHAQSRQRAYFYGRAKMIVGSIPVDRV